MTDKDQQYAEGVAVNRGLIERMIQDLGNGVRPPELGPERTKRQMLSEHDQQELRKWMVTHAILYHKKVEGEYGCPGETCPGVQRLVKLLEDWTATVFLLVRWKEGV
jgi:hypothetical protein